MIITLKKIGVWLKSYWYIPAVLIAILVALVVYRKVPKSLMDIITKRREIHQKEINAIDKIHAEEIEKREKSLRIYHQTISAIEEKYDKDKVVLTNHKKKQIKKIIDEAHNNPNILAEKISDQMGFEIVYPKDEE